MAPNREPRGLLRPSASAHSKLAAAIEVRRTNHLRQSAGMSKATSAPRLDKPRLDPVRSQRMVAPAASASHLLDDGRPSSVPSAPCSEVIASSAGPATYSNPASASTQRWKSLRPQTGINVPFRVSLLPPRPSQQHASRTPLPIMLEPPSTKTQAPQWYVMPSTVAAACDRFDVHHTGLQQRSTIRLIKLEADVTSEGRERRYKRSLCEIRAQRLHVQPLRWRGAENGANTVLGHGSYAGRRHPRAPPRGSTNPRSRRQGWESRGAHNSRGGLMSDGELDEAEARLAELKRRAAAGELSDEEMR